MFANPMEVKRRLVQEYHLPENHAEGIIDAFSSAEDQVATRSDLETLGVKLETLEARLRATIWRVGGAGVGVVLAALATATTVIVSYG